MPLLWRHLALVRQFAGAGECFLVDDVQHHLRVHVATHGAGAGLGVGIAGRLLEVGDGVDGVAVEDGVAALVEQPQAVEQLIDVARRLVNVDNDELSLEGLFLQQVDDLLGVRRRESRRRLVEEEHRRFAYQLQGDVQALALSAADKLVDGRTHLQVLGGLQSQVLQDFHDAAVQLVAGHTLETQLGREPQVLVDRQFLYQQVVLRHEAYERLRRRFRDVVAVDGERALLRLHTAVQEREQRRLARAGAAHDGQQFAVAEREAQVVYAVVAAGESEVDVASAVLYRVYLLHLSAHPLLVGFDDGGVVDGPAVAALQHTALQHHLIGSRQYWHVVQQQTVRAGIGEDQHAR